MAASDKKIAEGMENIREAEKCLKTGFLKWKPDYEGAGVEYGKAAIAFKNGKALDRAIESYMKQAEVLEKSGSDFHAAKALEAAALIHRDTGDLGKAADLIEKAANMFLEHGTPSSAAVMLDKAGKMLEQSLPDRAVKLFMKGCDVSEAEDRVKDCAEMVGKAGRILIRQKRFDEAAAAIKREIQFYNTAGSGDVLSKLVMGLVLIHLHMGDSVAADKAFQQCLSYVGFAESNEAAMIQRLIEAYDEGDQERAEQIAKNPLFRYMENDFTKLARDLRVPASLQKAKPAAPPPSSSSAAQSAVGGDVTEQTGMTSPVGGDDDEYPDLL